MIIVFDLDDTLYDEFTYVRSGFKAVATYLGQQYGISTAASFRFMWRTLQINGRGQIFDETLRHFDFYSKANVRACLSVYRNHTPKIRLKREAEACLKRFVNHSIYLVTDGTPRVQRRKIRALGLHDRVKFSYVTYAYGLNKSKPSPYCFLQICKREKIKPSELVYVADNPKKDFVGIKPLGFKTIRVLTGQHKNVKMPARFEADLRIKSLTALKSEVLKKL